MNTPGRFTFWYSRPVFGYVSDNVIIISSTYANSPISIHDRFDLGPYNNRRSMLEEFHDVVVEAQRYRKELYRTMRAEECETRMSPKPIPEAQFKKPTFVRRACGGRWRVMRP